jgi:3-oxoacyl-[acyl-carrier-protein] synthase II
MTANRVVVTGLASVSPLGTDLASTWEGMLAGKNGIKPITSFDTAEFATTFAGEVTDFDISAYIDAKQARRMDRFTQFAVAAAKMLLQDADLEITPANAPDIGVIVGVGLGGIHSIEGNTAKLLKSGPKRINPFFVPMMIANLAAGHVSIFTGAQGANICTTTACASGLHGIGVAYTDLMLGRAKGFICGGSEAVISPLGMGGFNAMKALSTRNDAPEKASRPFDKDRDGFVMGEGAGLMYVETLDSAKERGARIYAEIVGYGAAGDAYHMAAPPEDGDGMGRSMAAAIKEAGVDPSVVDHINCHATSTPAGDMCEVRAIHRIFGDHAPNIALTANKSQIGHLLGAAGGVEAVATVKSIQEGRIPPTINLDNPDPEFDLDCVTGAPREVDINYAMCNSFGFGGTNCSVLFKKFAG